MPCVTLVLSLLASQTEWLSPQLAGGHLAMEPLMVEAKPPGLLIKGTFCWLTPLLTPTHLYGHSCFAIILDVAPHPPTVTVMALTVTVPLNNGTMTTARQSRYFRCELPSMDICRGCYKPQAGMWYPEHASTPVACHSPNRFLLGQGQVAVGSSLVDGDGGTLEET